MGLRDEIISKLYLDKDIDEAISRMDPPHLREDLKSEMFLVLCNMDESRLIDMHNNGYLKFYLVRTMLSMIKSDRSTFYTKYRRVHSEWTEKNDQIDDTDKSYDEIVVKLKKSMEVLHWYEKSLLEIYVDNGGNILKISRDTGIPYRSLMKTFKKIRTLLKYKIKNQNHDDD